LIDALDPRNVADKYKSWDVERIRSDVKASTRGFALAMFQVHGDFNFSTVVRNGNAFGAECIIYIGPSAKWDRRGAVGTYHYTDVHHFESIDNFLEFCSDEGYTLYGIENNIELGVRPTNLFEFTDYAPKPIFLFGEEQQGIPREYLEFCDTVLEIPHYGSVRSINVGTASGIVAGWFSCHIRSHHD